AADRQPDAVQRGHPAGELVRQLRDGLHGTGEWYRAVRLRCGQGGLCGGPDLTEHVAHHAVRGVAGELAADDVPGTRHGGQKLARPADTRYRFEVFGDDAAVDERARQARHRRGRQPEAVTEIAPG